MLKRSLHSPVLGTWLGAAPWALVVFVQVSGVRLLAIPYLCGIGRPHNRRLVPWLGAAMIAALTTGASLHLDSNGEIYFFLLLRLPMAVLAAGSVVSVIERVRCWRRPLGELALRSNAARTERFAALVRGWFAWFRLRVAALALAGIGVTFALQSGSWVAHNQAGVAEWLRARPQLEVNTDLLSLYETMHWVREHTEPDAILVANAFTSKNLRVGRGVLVDHTTAGVNYNYSALSERRLWVEGPTYQFDFRRVQERLRWAEEIFYGGMPPSAVISGLAPYYVMIDHSIGDDAQVALPVRDRVFANARFEIFRLPRKIELPSPRNWSRTTHASGRLRLSHAQERRANMKASALDSNRCPYMYPTSPFTWRRNRSQCVDFGSRLHCAYFAVI